MDNSTGLRLPGPRDAAVLAVAVVAVSTSAPIIAACTAPALAIAFWRCALGAAATAAWALRGGPGAFGSLDRRARGILLLAGVLLALHFATWIPSLRFTSIASATALVSTLPLWSALLARAAGVRVGRGVWLGIGVAFAGIMALTGIDFSLDPRSLIGNALALVGGMLAAAYVTVGERVRQGLSTAGYTFVAYTVAAAVLLPLCLVTGAALTGYSTRDWVLIAALTVLAQLLGHTLVNSALRTTSATVVSLALLFELPCTILVAAAWLGQWPAPEVVPALVLLVVGLGVVVRSARSGAA